MNRFSLRTRIVALAVTLVAFAVALVGVATYIALHSYLSSQLEGQLQDVLSRPRLAVCSQDAVGGGGQTYPAGHSFAAALVDSTNGTVTQFSCAGSVKLAGDLPLSNRQGATLAAAPRQYFSVSTSAGGYLAAAVPSDRGLVAVGVSTRDVDGTLNRLVALELIIGGAAVVATGVLSAVGVRLGMRPLDRVTRTARTVAAELGPDGSGLENRVPDADPRTEVGQLAEAVNTMLGAVEREYTARYESEQRLRRFLADASHELRTPLTSLRGYAELVRMRGGLDPEASDSLRRIEAEGTRMSGLVDDLLTLARSDRGTVVERVPVDVAEVVDDAVAGVRAAFPQRQVAVTDRGPLLVLGDRNQLLQVVTNVLTNAAVHATAPVPIQVTAVQEGAEVVVRVTDGGPGLPPEQAAQVFDRFWRADAARTRVRGGSGLGLSIVAALVADHGGRVSFDSTVEHGTTVTVRLPAAPVPAEPPAAAPAAPYAAPGS
jgi:two-component system OmpR family sensor kinase